MTALLEAKGVSAGYGKIAALSDITVSIPHGSVVTVVGPNGAGKTTLLRAVAGLIRHEGDVLLHGRDVATMSRRERSRHVALVPQTPLIPRGMTVEDYVLLGRTAHLPTLAMESTTDLAIAGEAIEQLELETFTHGSVDTLSGGERQRVVVARMLAQQAPLALLDEPTSALDVGHQQQVLDLVDELRHGQSLTVVATMHDLTVAGQYGDRIALVVDGTLVASGTAIEVLTEEVLSHHYRARVRVVEGEDGPIIVPVRRTA